MPWPKRRISPFLEMLSLIERSITFKPDSLNHGALDNAPHERVTIGREFGLELDAAWFPNGSETAVLYLHGNRHNITRFHEHYRLFKRLGVSCLTFDYPGYGKSVGTPSESSLYASARAAYSYLTNSLGFPEGQITIFGSSLGGAVAIELASVMSPGCLITESTFTNSHDMGRHLYPYLPIAPFFKRRFNNDALIADIKIPHLIIHGAKDLRVPVSMAQILHERAINPKELVIIPDADHISCLAVGGEDLTLIIERFIKTHCLTTAHEPTSVWRS